MSFEEDIKELPTHVLADRLRKDAFCSREAVLEVVERLEEMGTVFDHRWKADMRAVHRWQEANPGKHLVWPDHADLVIWLLDQLNKEKVDDRSDPRSA